ncbi:hypothetical protein PAGU2638_04750 [Lysobacter sp. PAGU 2638]
MIPATLADAAVAMHLNPDARFTPHLQDRILFDYLIGQRRPAVHDYIAGKPGATLTDAQHAMACEWASFGDPAKGGQSHYPPPNHASITLEQSGAALTSMRNDYRAAIERGLTPADAWTAATGSSPTHDQAAPNTLAAHAPSTHRSERPAAMTDGALTSGESGPEVATLQRALDRLGYKDAHGHHIAADGHFGQHTREALQAFQRDHHLDAHGSFGPKTQTALHAAEASLVTSRTNPHHALYERTLEKVREAEHARGVASGPHSERMAAALTTELVRDGITRVDRVEFNSAGTLVRAVQIGAMRDEPGLNHSTGAISTRQASTQSVAESSRQLHEVAVNVQAQRQDPQFTQTPTRAAPSPAH